MQITGISLDTQAGPSDWFTGSVHIDTVGTPSGAARLSASNVHLRPGARTAWHTHPNGQTIYVLEGVGLCQVRGGPIEVIRRRPTALVHVEPTEKAAICAAFCRALWRAGRTRAAHRRRGQVLRYNTSDPGVQRIAGLRSPSRD